VFDGRNPPYYPDSTPKYQPSWLDLTYSPLNFYGETKLNGERAALAANLDSAISLRVPVLYIPFSYVPSDIHRYGEGENDESAVNTLLDGALVSSSPFNESQLTNTRTNLKNQKSKWTM
jgi:nucleoside-diphosphate-sugar epimerase